MFIKACSILEQARRSLEAVILSLEVGYIGAYLKISYVKT